MKILNIKGLIILVAIFVVIQLASAFIISPILAPIIIENINKTAGTKISADKITVWPLTLSVSLKNLKVFDPDNEKVRIALVKDASLRISPLGLLSKRLVIARLGIYNAVINLKGESDGSFNVQKLTRPKEAKATAKKTGMLDRFKGKKDLFGRIYDGIKQKTSEKEKDKKVPQKVEREVQDLPHGRLVKFIKPSDRYIFEIKKLVIKKSKIDVETEKKERITIENAGVYIENLGLDPAAGARFSKLGAKGTIKKNGKLSGSFDLDYSQSFSQRKEAVSFILSAKDVDLTAVKFVYGDSVPVNFEKGTISINSRTNIVNGNLDSNNSIVLKDHTVLPKNKAQVVGFLPLPVICDAINKINPFKIKFKITGTVTSPEFKGFEQVLLELIKPYVANLQENLKQEGLKKVGDIFQGKTDSTTKKDSSEKDTTSNALQSITSLFGSKDKK